MVERTCNVCGLACPEDGPDPCLGMLPGVSAACCGHGGVGYVMFDGGKVLRGRFDHTVTSTNVEPGKSFSRAGLPRKDWNDLNITAVAVVREYSVDFELYSLIGAGEPIEDADRIELDGHVKWDGCSNWMTPSGNYDIHRCDQDGLKHIGEAMARCWEWTSELLPTWLE